MDLCIRRFSQFLEKLTRLSGTTGILSNISPVAVKQNVSRSQKVILDVGCGKGEFTKSLFNLDKSSIIFPYTIGLDIFIPSLLIAKKICDDVVRCDIKFLPIRAESCNIVLASQVIEHLTKNEGLNLMKDLERVSKEAIIITVPVGQNSKQHLEDNNPWQTHRSAWYPDEFKARGFKVYGYAGARFLFRERGEYKLKSRILWPIFYALSLLTQCVTRWFVTASYKILCIKTFAHR
jgi:ubiquinone/menaquinone biosynthesis C-methylase UbiE